VTVTVTVIQGCVSCCACFSVSFVATRLATHARFFELAVALGEDCRLDARVSVRQTAS
jgi:hypothetical protein